MHKILLVDVDGVCLNWNDAFDAHMANLGHILDDDFDSHYHLPTRYGVDPDYMNNVVANFNTSHHISKLNVFRDAATYLPKLKQDGFEIHAITSIGDDPVCKKFRKKNLVDIFGKNVFASVTCIPMYTCKSEYLKEWNHSNFMWIEDSPNNSQVGHELGLKSYLIDHNYNRGVHEHIPRVSNESPWSELYHIITAHYSSP